MAKAVKSSTIVCSHNNRTVDRMSAHSHKNIFHGNNTCVSPLPPSVLTLMTWAGTRTTSSILWSYSLSVFLLKHRHREILYPVSPSIHIHWSHFSNHPLERILFDPNQWRQRLKCRRNELQKEKASPEDSTGHTWVVGELWHFPRDGCLCVCGLDCRGWPAPVNDRGLHICKQKKREKKVSNWRLVRKTVIIVAH